VPRYRRSTAILAALLLSLVALAWFSLPLSVGDASHNTAATLPSLPVGKVSRPLLPDMRAALAPGRRAALLHQVQAREQLDALHGSLWLHAQGSQLLTAWNAPVTLKAINWYGFDYAPFVAEGLDRLPLDDILATIRRLGFNAIRLPFANETVESNPVVTTELAANPGFRGLHAIDIMQRLIERAHDFGVRVILVNSRSEGGRGPELKTGLWYTRRYPITSWYADWETLARRLRNDDAFVGADLRNEPHIIGSQFTEQSYFQYGPLWGAYHGVYYHDRDWHYAAETLGNDLLTINPHLLIIVEGVQMYLDPDRGVLTGGLWGGNLIGVQYDPIVLNRPGRLVYSVHEYGPHMWQGNWFTPHTTYASLARRWNHLWGYLLTASRALQAPVFVGEFGTCHEYFECVSGDQGWKQGFWFKSFIRYLSLHPQVGWAYWSLNPTGPFHPGDENFYSLLTTNWRHYYPLLAHGLQPILREPNGLWNTGIPAGQAITPLAGCFADRSCLPGVDTPPASAQPTTPAPATAVRVVSGLGYAGVHDALRSGDLYLPQSRHTGSRPAVIILHGGSWSDGTRGTPETRVLAEVLARHGYVAFDINYRLVGRHGAYPRNVRDVRAAADFLAANAHRFGVDPARIAVAGMGAGGYLGLMAAYAPQAAPFEPANSPSPPVRIVAAASLFAPIHLPDVLDSPGADIIGSLQTYLGRQIVNPRAASPDTYVDSGVPTIIFGGLADPDAPFHDAFNLYKGLRQRSIHSQLIDLPGAPRALTDLSPGERRIALLQITRFFDGVFYAPSEQN
jgi:endoglucanase